MIIPMAIADPNAGSIIIASTRRMGTYAGHRLNSEHFIIAYMAKIMTAISITRRSKKIVRIVLTVCFSSGVTTPVGDAVDFTVSA
jgi:hypothetical protein